MRAFKLFVVSLGAVLLVYGSVELLIFVGSLHPRAYELFALGVCLLIVLIGAITKRGPFKPKS